MEYKFKEIEVNEQQESLGKCNNCNVDIAVPYYDSIHDHVKLCPACID